MECFLFRIFTLQIDQFIKEKLSLSIACKDNGNFNIRTNMILNVICISNNCSQEKNV